MKEHPIYWTDPTRAKFTVRVEQCHKLEDGHLVVISSPVVKPTGGGQAGDRGVIVIGDTQVRFSETVEENDEIALVTDTPIRERTEAVLQVDMDWRESMMRNHTGEHLFAKAMIDLHGDARLGRIWVDGDHGTIDISGCRLEPSDVLSVEKRVQQAISDALPVTSQVVSSDSIEEAVRAREGVTSSHEMLRIVEIEGFDKSACSGIHVQNTRDIGTFKVVDYRLDDENAHIEFLTGPAAMALLSSVYNEVLERRHAYPFEMEQLGAILDKSKSLREAYDELAETLLSSLVEGGQYTEVGKFRLRTEYLPGFDSKKLRDLSNRMVMPESSLLLLFTSAEHDGKTKCNLVVRTNAMPHDASHYVLDAVADLGGQGGGSNEVYTGGFVGHDEPGALFVSISEKLRERLARND